MLERTPLPAGVALSFTPNYTAMNIAEIMTRDVQVAQPHDTLQQAAQKMRDLDIGSLPVCDGKRLQGMLTDRDIAIRAVAEGLNVSTTRCSDIMTDEVYFVHDTETVENAAKAMSKRQVRRLPIVDAQMNLVGIVALGDLATDTEDDARKGDVLEDISKSA